MLMLLLFFFSSRRRHTRCLSDWSSDVCSSDLKREEFKRFAPLLQPGDFFIVHDWGSEFGAEDRSEERRVGKECRYPWSPCDLKNKTKRKEMTDAVYYHYVVGDEVQHSRDR